MASQYPLVFNRKNPLATDPSLEDVHGEDYAWGKSKEPNVYYAWVQAISQDVSLHPTLDPEVVDLGLGIILYIYRGPIKQDMLYRIHFERGLPQRLAIKPSPYCMFWSYGKETGPSARIKYHYRDRHLTIHEWVGKDSYLAVLRQQHYVNAEASFWSR